MPSVIHCCLQVLSGKFKDGDYEHVSEKLQFISRRILLDVNNIYIVKADLHRTLLSIF